MYHTSGIQSAYMGAFQRQVAPAYSHVFVFLSLWVSYWSSKRNCTDEQSSLSPETCSSGNFLCLSLPLEWGEFPKKVFLEVVCEASLVELKACEAQNSHCYKSSCIPAGLFLFVPFFFKLVTRQRTHCSVYTCTAT